MADSLPTDAGSITMQEQDESAPSSQDTQPANSPAVAPPSNNLVGAELLNGLLPSLGGGGGGPSPLRVRRRGARRLQYDEQAFELDGESGDLGQHSLAHQELRKTSPKVALPEVQPPSYLQKRLVSLRRKRQDSPIPPNLIDALTSLLSPPASGSPGAGGPLEGIIGLGILQTPPTGLGITTPENKKGDDFFAE